MSTLVKQGQIYVSTMIRLTMLIWRRTECRERHRSFLVRIPRQGEKPVPWRLRQMLGSCISCITWASSVAQLVKNLPAMQETWVRSLGRKDPLEKEMATHSSTLAWRILWTEELGKLQSRGSQRVGNEWEINFHFTFIYYRKKILHVHWPAQFKPTLFNGQLYMFFPLGYHCSIKI